MCTPAPAPSATWGLGVRLAAFVSLGGGSRVGGAGGGGGAGGAGGAGSGAQQAAVAPRRLHEVVRAARAQSRRPHAATPDSWRRAIRDFGYRPPPPNDSRRAPESA